MGGHNDALVVFGQCRRSGIFVGHLSHELITAVLVHDGDFQSVGIDVELKRLLGNLLDGILNGLGVDGKGEVAFAFHQVDAGEDGRFVVRGCEVQLLALQTEEETIKNGQTVFGGNHSAQGLKAL